MLSLRLGTAAGLTLLCAMQTACAPPVSEGGFDSADPASRLYAIERAMRENDASAIPKIVEQLDADDPAVRLLAISALQQLTGETMGYDYADTPERRRAAVKAWMQAVDSGRFAANAAAAPSAAEGDSP
jgi:hypothetical protein